MNTEVVLRKFVVACIYMLLYELVKHLAGKNLDLNLVNSQLAL